MNDYVVTIEGLDSFDQVAELDRLSQLNQARAVNKTLDRVKAWSSQNIRENINLTRTYLAQRIGVTKRASPGAAEGIVKASDRPISLARYVVSRRAKGKGVTVEVKPGRKIQMARAFILDLANGGRGLAIRLKPGETLRNKKEAKEIGKGLYVLYGPSVNQAFRMIAEDRVDEFAAFLENEFIRLQSLEK